MYLNNQFTRAFNLEVPVVQGPMAGISGPRLVAAVANAGALGILPIWIDTIEQAVAAIEQTKALTERPFAVNLRADLVQLDHIKASADAGVTIIHLFWGSPAASMPAVTSAGARMIATVSDNRSALAALDAGAVALIAQGVEAGGHVLGSIPRQSLLESVLEVAGDVPVIAAGGCADGEDIRQQLDLSAQGVLLGSRFVASDESEAHEKYKQAIVEAGVDATIRSLCFDVLWPNAPHRTLKNLTTETLSETGNPKSGHRPNEEDIVMRTGGGEPIPRYSALPPHESMTGNVLEAATYAGTCVDKILSCDSVGQVIQDIKMSLEV